MRYDGIFSSNFFTVNSVRHLHNWFASDHVPVVGVYSIDYFTHSMMQLNAELSQKAYEKGGVLECFR